MASDVSIRYTLDYKITFDVDVAKTELPSFWEESDGDEDLFVEFVTDLLMSRLELLEQMKSKGLTMPKYITHFSLSEGLS